MCNIIRRNTFKCQHLKRKKEKIIGSQNVKSEYGLKSENKVKVDVKGSQNITSKNEMFIPKHILEKHEHAVDENEGLEVVIGVKQEIKEDVIEKPIIDEENTPEEKLEVEITRIEEKEEETVPEVEEVIQPEVVDEKEEVIPEQVYQEEVIELPDDVELVEEKEEIKEEPKKEKKPKKNKKSEDKSNKPVVQKDKSVLNPDEKPEYVKEMIENRKRRTKKFIIISVLAVCVVLFSTLFAIINLSNTNFISGIKLHGIDISNKSIDEVRTVLEDITKTELIPEIKLIHGDYEATVLSEQIEFKYNLEESLQEAYDVGRNGNIIQNNYAIIFSKLFGKDIELDYSYNEELLDSIVEDINSKLPGVVIEPSYYIEDAKLIIAKGKDGLTIRKNELKANIIYEIVHRDYEMIKANKHDTRQMLPISNVHASKIDMDRIYKEVYSLPQDAYFELDPYQIYPDKDGIDFEISIEDAKEMLKEDKEEYIVPLKITKAEKTLNDLGTEAFPYLVSEFTTKYDASNRNRSTNLQIAADKINGLVLMPGETFSFNKTVGKRTVEAGYKDAKIYADGGVVDGLAGGICQISSTLYNAVLLANLEIVERRNHTFTTSYLPAGKDATVVYGVTDFRFKNTRQYPIKLEASVKNGIAEFKIHGMEEEKEYEIRILPVRTSSIPFKVTYEEDPTLMPGQEKIVQAGHAGYKVTTYKEVRYNGQVVSKDVISSDTYSPMRTIKKVAPGMAPPVQ